MRLRFLPALALLLCATGASASGPDKQPRRATSGDLEDPFVRSGEQPRDRGAVLDPWAPRKPDSKIKRKAPAKPSPRSHASGDLVDPFARRSKPVKPPAPATRPKPRRPRASSGGELLDPWSKR